MLVTAHQIPDTTPHRSPSAASFLRRVGSPAVNRQPSSTYADAASSTVNFTNPPQHVDINGALGKPSVAPRKLNSRNWRQPNYHRKPTQEKKKSNRRQNSRVGPASLQSCSIEDNHNLDNRSALATVDRGKHTPP